MALPPNRSNRHSLSSAAASRRPRPLLVATLGLSALAVGIWSAWDELSRDARDDTQIALISMGGRERVLDASASGTRGIDRDPFQAQIVKWKPEVPELPQHTTTGRRTRILDLSAVRPLRPRPAPEPVPERTRRRPPLLQVGNGGVPAGRQAGVTPGGLGSQAAGGGVDFDPLLNLITSTVAPDTWIDEGGSGSVAPYYPGLAIVVRQTQAVHEQIADVLRQLRGGAGRMCP